MNAFDELANNFSRLPGIGKKSANRMVNWLLKQDASYVQKFAQNLGSLQEKIKPCSVCGTWTESDPCPICANPLRDVSQICVVEQPQDVSTIEAYGEYKGLYHVLGGLLRPLEGMSARDVLEKVGAIDLLDSIPDKKNFIIAPGCDMPYSVPVENCIGVAQAAIDTVRLFNKRIFKSLFITFHCNTLLWANLDTCTTTTAIGFIINSNHKY